MSTERSFVIDLGDLAFVYCCGKAGDPFAVFRVSTGKVKDLTTERSWEDHCVPAQTRTDTR